MSHYRKKPVVIEAVQYGGEIIPGVCTCVQELGHHLHTAHEGQTVRLTIGDWIIPEKEPGRFYPCKPDVFAVTYEPASAPRVEARALSDAELGYIREWLRNESEAQRMHRGSIGEIVSRLLASALGTRSEVQEAAQRVADLWSSYQPLNPAAVDAMVALVASVKPRAALGEAPK